MSRLRRWDERIATTLATGFPCFVTVIGWPDFRTRSSKARQVALNSDTETVAIKPSYTR
jgi:hypothetical protein